MARKGKASEEPVQKQRADGEEKLDAAAKRRLEELRRRAKAGEIRVEPDPFDPSRHMVYIRAREGVDSWIEDGATPGGFPAGTRHTIDHDTDTHVVTTPDGVACSWPVRRVASEQHWRDGLVADSGAWLIAESRAKQGARSRAGVQTKQDIVAGRRREVAVLASDPRYSGLSQRKLAEHIAKRLPRDEDATRRWGVNTIRDDLRELGLPKKVSTR